VTTRVLAVLRRTVDREESCARMRTVWDTRQCTLLVTIFVIAAVGGRTFV
jgi:hypothetical protein